MKTPPFIVCLLLAAALVAGCGEDKQTEPTKSGDAAVDMHGHSHGDGAHGGALVDLGAHEGHIEVVCDHAQKSVTIYVLDPDMNPAPADKPPVLNLKTESGHEQLTAEPVRASDKTAWLFRHDELQHENVTGRFRIAYNGKTYLPDFEHSHGEHHAHGPHDGMVAAFRHKDGTAVGFLELKLHDDKGDLELWLARDETITQHYDIPLDSKITVTFEDKGNRSVTLQVRNKEENEDEDGNPNMRRGKTNYFIFPGDTGADASWLMGLDFHSHVVVKFTENGEEHISDEFELIPHSHGGPGHSHDADTPSHHHGPHDGMVTAFRRADGTVAGFLELKLHDDKGDLELWLARDEAITQHHDIPLDGKIYVTLKDKDDKTVTLQVRNKAKNEDEEGKPNIRGGKTNYFIFPGDTGADASWLKGLDFKSETIVNFQVDGKKYASDVFTLIPHTHTGPGHAHD